MGVEPLPNLMVRLKAGAQLKPKDVQAFMLWALGIGSVPDWATLRLPHLIPGVVCLMINSLGSGRRSLFALSGRVGWVTWG